MYVNILPVLREHIFLHLLCTLGNQLFLSPTHFVLSFLSSERAEEVDAYLSAWKVKQTTV